MAERISSDDIHTARLMRREGKTIAYIARRMNRSRGLIGEIVHGYARVVQHEVQVVQIPASVLADRDARLALSPRDLTAAIAGDPLPGMSALERKKAAASARVSLRPHPEERSEAARLEGHTRRIYPTCALKIRFSGKPESGWRPILRDAVLRIVPQDEAEQRAFARKSPMEDAS
jgi:hypothetical protein